MFLVVFQLDGVLTTGTTWYEVYVEDDRDSYLSVPAAFVKAVL